MIRECLNEIVVTNIDLGDKIKNTIKKYLDSYDDQDLYLIMSQTSPGLPIGDISIYFYPNVGFRCISNSRLGNLPICNIINRILNEYYSKLVMN